MTKPKFLKFVSIERGAVFPLNVQFSPQGITGINEDPWCLEGGWASHGDLCEIAMIRTVPSSQFLITGSFKV